MSTKQWSKLHEDACALFNRAVEMGDSCEALSKFIECAPWADVRDETGVSAAVVDNLRERVRTMLHSFDALTKSVEQASTTTGAVIETDAAHQRAEWRNRSDEEKA